MQEFGGDNVNKMNDMGKGLQIVFDKYKDKVLKTDDLTLLVLKGHLFIEEILGSIIKTIVTHENIVDTARLNFSQKAIMARAMCWDQHNNEVWAYIASINSLRNEMAHSLDSDRVKTKLNGLINKFKSENENIENESNEYIPQNDLEWFEMVVLHCVGFLCGFYKDAILFDKVANSMFIRMKELTKSNLQNNESHNI